MNVIFYEKRGILQSINAMAPVGNVSSDLGVLIANRTS